LRGVIANIRSATVLGNGDAVSSLAWGEREAARDKCSVIHAINEAACVFIS